MGVACGDFDRNGKLDLHITNFANEPSALYLQQDHGIFVNQTIGLHLEEATYAMVGWGTQAADFDNNGWTDVAILNGHIYPSLPDGSPYQMLPQMFRGGPEGFAIVEPESATYWSTPRLGRSLVKLDWNQDGLVDLAGGHLDAPIALLQNSSTDGNWIQLELVATESERSAIGAQVRVVCAKQEWMQWVTSGDGYQSSNEAVLAIGLGDEPTIERVEVSWPSGAETSFTLIEPNQRYLLVENESIAIVRPGTNK
jgi:ASPIC and UnbV/FG-GAP-like repeat